VDAIEAATRVNLPTAITTGFAGTAQAYQDSLGTEPLLILTALCSVYIVLGILYESYIHSERSLVRRVYASRGGCARAPVQRGCGGSEHCAICCGSGARREPARAGSGGTRCLPLRLNGTHLPDNRDRAAPQRRRIRAFSTN
jgi:hypothetical protein